MRGPPLTALQLRNALSALARRLPSNKPADMTPIGEFGPLRVREIARIDLISLKAIASRQRDMEDLLSLAVTHAEAAFVIASLPQILEQGTNPDLVENAIETMRLFLRPEGGGDEPR
jgi:hypothetical protein